jgi:hypothetical protein
MLVCRGFGEGSVDGTQQADGGFVEISCRHDNIVNVANDRPFQLKLKLPIVIARNHEIEVVL